MTTKVLTKQLPVNHSFVKSYPRHAYCMSILSNHEQCLPWIYCNYIQLYCNTSRAMDKDWFDYYVLDPLGNFNPWFYTTNARLTRDIIAQLPSIVEFIINSIDLGYYVVAHLDDYYIPASPIYLKHYYPHGYLIFGYDMDKRTLDMAGFFENKMYQNTKISYDDFELAYKGAGKWVDAADDDRREFEFMDYVNSLHLFKVYEQGKFDFDLQCVIEQLEDYLYSRNTSERYRVRENSYEGIFGLKVYEYMASLLGVMIHTEVQERSQLYYDARPFYILSEHKKLMVSRIQFMIDQGISSELVTFRDAFDELYEKSLYLQQTFIKFMIRQGKDDTYIRTIIQKLPEIAEQEGKIIAELVVELKKVIN